MSVTLELRTAQNAVAEVVPTDDPNQKWSVLGSEGRDSYWETEMWSAAPYGSFGEVREWKVLGGAAGWEAVPDWAVEQGFPDPNWMKAAASAPPDPAPKVANPVKKAVKVAASKMKEVLPDGRVYFDSVFMHGVSWLTVIRSLLDDPKVPGIRIAGPPGSGKTFMGEVAAGLGVFTVNVNEASSVEALMGVMGFDLKKGIFYVDSPIVKAAKHRHGKKCPARCGKSTVIINELNRLPLALQSVLLPVLEQPCVIVLPGQDEAVVAGPDFTVLSTENPYVDLPLDQALSSRMGAVYHRDIQWDIVKKLCPSKKLVTIGQLTHKAYARGDLDCEPLGTRELIAANRDYERMIALMGDQEAFDYAVAGFLSSDALAAEQVSAIIQDTIGRAVTQPRGK